MESNKRGLSTVVTTLIIVLLVLVAIVIIWVVIRGIIESGGEQSDALTRCNLIDLEITSVTTGCDETGCNLIVKRNPGADSKAISGIRVVLSDASGNSAYKDVPGDIAVLGTLAITAAGYTGTVTAATKVEVAAIVQNAGGEPQICPLTSSYDL